VENSLGHQAAWLSRWSERSRNEIQLVAPTLIAGRNDHTISVGDAGAVTGAFDLAYLDPPYNTNNPHTKTTRIRYSGYYHLWTTIVKNDRPEIFGATCRRADSSDRVPGALSEFEKIDYESNRRALATLLSSIDARYYLLSYSNKGKLKKDDIMEILSTRGKVSVTEIPHKENVQKSLTSTQQHLGDASANLEYLFLVKSR
jgi:adenine-specific DNA-methyltransferase